MSSTEQFEQYENPPRWHFQDGLEISVPETAKLHAQNTDDFVLIDIRESEELDICTVTGAIHIPMGDLPSRINEIDADEDTTIALICHTGRRSLNATLFLHQQGLAGTRSVAGGIEWWSLRIDPSIPRY